MCYNLLQMVCGCSGGDEMTFTEFMRRVRRNLDMNQEDFAKALNVSYTTINRWENKHVAPSQLGRKSFIDFCKARDIEIPPEVLADGAGNSKGE
jgi:transcriptional regulator with XRE-family HTH domain